MYYVFIIGTAAGTVDVGFDTDSSATNLLADATGYTFYRIVRDNFAVFTNSSSNILSFSVVGNQVRYLSTILDVNDLTITNDTYETGTITAPPNSIALLMVTGQASAASVNAGITITLKNPTTTEAKAVIQSVAPTVIRIAGPAEFPVNASRQLQYKAQLYVGDTINYVGINTGGYFLQG